MIQIKIITTIDRLLKEKVMTLWNQEYPIGLKYESIDQFDDFLAKTSNPKHYIIESNDELIGWIATFIRDEEKWFSIILNSNYQGKGYGTQLINEAKKKEIYLNGWVVDHNNDIKSNGKPYQSPLSFYLKNDFEVLKEIRLETDKISAVKIRWAKS